MSHTLHNGLIHVLNRCGVLARFSVTAVSNGLQIPIINGLGYSLLRNAEPWLDATLARLLSVRPGVFLDVGVNIGQTLIKVVHADPAREYWGFEPNPSAIAYATALKELNHLARVHLVCVALSCRGGTARLSLASDEDTTASMIEGFRPAEFYRRHQTVAIVPGDDVVEDENIGAVSIVKIDVEGAEVEVLRGLHRTILRDRPFILCEVLPVYDETTAIGQMRRKRSDEIQRLLHEMDYELVRLMPDGSSVPLRTIETHADLNLSN
jgi:FkbM family methyltransferase